MSSWQDSPEDEIISQMKELYENLEARNEERFEEVLRIPMSLRALEGLNFSAFRHVDFLRLVGIDFRDFLKIAHHTPLQLGNRKKFIKMSSLLKRELTDRIKRPRLTKLYLDLWYDEVLIREDNHSFIGGTILLELVNKLKAVSGGAFDKVVESVNRRFQADLTEEDDY